MLEQIESNWNIFAIIFYQELRKKSLRGKSQEMYPKYLLSIWMKETKLISSLYD